MVQELFSFYCWAIFHCIHGTELPVHLFRDTAFLPVLGGCDENCCKWLIPVQVLYGHRFPSPLNKYQGLQLLGSMVTSRFGFVRNHQTAFEAAARGLTPTSSA